MSNNLWYAQNFQWDQNSTFTNEKFIFPNLILGFWNVGIRMYFKIFPNLQKDGKSGFANVALVGLFNFFQFMKQMKY